VRKKFQVDSDLANVQRASEDVLSFLKPLALSEAAVFDIRLCLEEAIINAMKYGNGLQKGVPVDLDVESTASDVRITVKDQGEGFDVSKLECCTDEKNLYRNRGRGVFLIHQLMDEVRYNDKGNSLLMVKKIHNSRGVHGSQVA
jgi:serine/threonine-protein kinase RsbW